MCHCQRRINFDPPFIAMVPWRHSIALIYLVGLVGGFIAGILLVLMRQRFGFNISKQE